MTPDSHAPLVLEVMSRSLELPEEECRLARWRQTPQWDSFAFVEIIAELEERLGVTFAEADFDRIEGYHDLCTLIEAHLAADLRDNSE